MHREETPPTGIRRVARLICGRRAGKSLILALTAVYLACFVSWHGEIRLSGFLLWQSVHSEFYFTDVLWPDFRKITSYALFGLTRNVTAALVAVRPAGRCR